MGPGQQSWLTNQWSIWVGSQIGLDRAGFGPVWAGLTRTRGVLWRCHVTALGLHWAVVVGCGRERGSRWTKRRWSMDLRQGPWWTKSTIISLGSALVHRVQGYTAQLAPPPLFLPRHASAGDVLTSELQQRCYRPIGVGKSTVRLW